MAVIDKAAVETAARASLKIHITEMADIWTAGVHTLDYGNSIRQVAKEEGLENAFACRGFVPAYIKAHLHRWLDMATERLAFRGLPARIGLGDRHRTGLLFNEMVASGA